MRINNPGALQRGKTFNFSLPFLIFEKLSAFQHRQAWIPSSEILRAPHPPPAHAASNQPATEKREIRPKISCKSPEDNTPYGKQRDDRVCGFTHNPSPKLDPA